MKTLGDTFTKGYEYHQDKRENIYYMEGGNNCCQPHYHKQIELLYIIDGQVEGKLNAMDYILESGDILISNPFDIHGYKNISDNTLSLVIIIPLRFQAYFTLCAGCNKFGVNIKKKSDHTKEIYNLMLNLKNHSEMDELTKSGYIFILLGAIMKAIGRHTTEDSKAISLMHKIINYIDSNYHEELSIDAIAKYCGYSKYYISKVFNASSDCNISEYINLRRLQAFHELQSTNREDIATNAMSAGFNSMRTFYKVFKEHYKTTPKNYIKSFKKYEL